MDEFLKAVKASAEKAGVFGEVKITRNGGLQCAAKNSAKPAWYRIDQADGKWNISLVTADRWLSESIEADLMHHGDPIEELIEEELVDQGYSAGPVEVKHYRSDDMLYTFRSVLPIRKVQDDSAAKTATQCLLAYEAAFRELGDMNAGEEE